MAGLSLLSAWTFFIVFDASRTAVASAAFPSGGLLLIVWAVFECLTIAAFLGGPLRQCATRLLGTAALRWSAALIAVGGSLCVSAAESTAVSALGLAGSAASGIALGVLNLVFGRAYGQLEREALSWEVPLTFPLATAITLAAMTLPAPIEAIAWSCLPLAAIGCLALTERRLGSPSHEAEAEAPRAEGLERTRARRLALRIGGCALLVNFADMLADSIVRAIVGAGAHAMAGIASAGPFLGASLGAALVIYLCLLFARKRPLRIAYRIAMLTMTAFFVLLPVLASLNEQVGAAILASYGGFCVLLWIFLARAARRCGPWGVVAFGGGWALGQLGMVAGLLFDRLVVPHLELDPQTLSLFALIATVCVLVSYMIVLRESDLRSLLEQPRDDEDAAEGPSDATAAMAAESAPGTEDAFDEDAYNELFEERCRTLAADHRLTPRETEVMLLLARGRSSARIEEELFISHGTCLTHMRHIYAKMDVHSRQEFLDLVEARLEPQDAS